MAITNNTAQFSGTVAQITEQISLITESLKTLNLPPEQRSTVLISRAAQLIAFKSPLQRVNVSISSNGIVTVNASQLKPQKTQELER